MPRSTLFRAGAVALAGVLTQVACGDEEVATDGQKTDSSESSDDEDTSSDGGPDDGHTSTGSESTGAGTETVGTSSTGQTSDTGETSGTAQECNAELRGAPEPVDLPDGMATPIDIKSVDVTITFDIEARLAMGDATVRFEMGETAGRPILDLRQAIDAVELDGAPLDTNQFHYQDLGGGDGADMRLLDRLLEACTDHELHLVYSVGSPHGSSTEVQWNSDTVRFRSSFNDLAPAGYAEKWMPANLAYDEVAMTMELEIESDAAPHIVLSNGDVEQLDTQKWRIESPDYFVTFSPFFVLTAADTVEEHTRVVALSEGDVTVEAYFRSGDVNRTLDTLEAGLLAFRDMYGPYAHGDRYVAYVREGGGGMEYEGATDSGDNPGVLDHELFHSWFARGVRPITATDGWWDEAWTTYNTGSDTFADYEALPFDYPAKALYDPNPWIRHTHGESYGYGARVFATIREAIGAQLLIDLMGQFYVDNRLGLTSTAELEQHLFCESGEEPDVHRIFHLFIHGNAGDAPPPPDDYCN